MVPLGFFPDSLSASSLVPPWFLYGSSLVPPWFFLGMSMDYPWFLLGSSLVPLWYDAPWFPRLGGVQLRNGIAITNFENWEEAPLHRGLHSPRCNQLPPKIHFFANRWRWVCLGTMRVAKISLKVIQKHRF